MADHEVHGPVRVVIPDAADQYGSAATEILLPDGRNLIELCEVQSIHFSPLDPTNRQLMVTIVVRGELDAYVDAIALLKSGRVEEGDVAPGA